jgi:AraC-like DNA-binding protein
MVMNGNIYIRILHCKTAKIDKNWNYPDLLCTHWRFYINSDKGAQLKAGGKTYLLGKDAIYLVPPWQRVSLYNQKPLMQFYVHFDVIGLTELICRKLFPPLLELGIADFAEISSFSKPKDCSEIDGFIADCRMKSFLYGLFYDYFNQISPEKRLAFEEILPAAGKYSQVYEHIENNLAAPIDNQTLARLSCQSQSHFIRNFSNDTGITPAKFTTQRRIAKAIEQLAFTDYSIDKIASETGFSDRFHFSKVFKKVCGTTPAAYRKQTYGV